MQYLVIENMTVNEFFIGNIRTVMKIKRCTFKIQIKRRTFKIQHYIFNDLSKPVLYMYFKWVLYFRSKVSIYKQEYTIVI